MFRACVDQADHLPCCLSKWSSLRLFDTKHPVPSFYMVHSWIRADFLSSGSQLTVIAFSHYCVLYISEWFAFIPGITLHLWFEIKYNNGEFHGVENFFICCSLGSEHIHSRAEGFCVYHISIFRVYSFLFHTSILTS